MMIIFSSVGVWFSLLLLVHMFVGGGWGNGFLGFVLFPSLMFETKFKVIATQIGAMGTMLQAR